MPKESSLPPDSKKRTWWNTSNAARKERYANDPVYRAECQERAAAYKRETYPTLKPNCRENLTKLWSIGTARILNGESTKRLTFSFEEAAKAVGGFTPVALRRWIQEGLFPAPNRKENKEGAFTGPAKQLYTEQQMVGIISVMAQHQDTKRKLRPVDTGVIRALKDCMLL